MRVEQGERNAGLSNARQVSLPPLTRGTLYLIATPIGNLEDITLRALRTLKECDVVAAEDTRRTGQLLKHFQIAKPLLSYFRFNEAKRSEEIIARLRGGQTVALVTDAGSPGISDPGERVVQAALAAGRAGRHLDGVADLGMDGNRLPEISHNAFGPRRGDGEQGRARGNPLAGAMQNRTDFSIDGSFKDERLLQLFELLLLILNVAEDDFVHVPEAGGHLRSERLNLFLPLFHQLGTVLHLAFRLVVSGFVRATIS